GGPAWVGESIGWRDLQKPPHERGVARTGVAKGWGVTACVTGPPAVSRLVSLAFVPGNAVPLRQPIECASMNPEQLGGELLVPARLHQDTTEMVSDHVLETQGRSGLRRSWCRGTHQLGRQVLG